jgi:hypothetical protein
MDNISINNIYRANLSGGIIGWLTTSSKRALESVCRTANSRGEEVVFVIQDTMNIFRWILYLLIFCITLSLWCPWPGYLVITRRISVGDSNVLPPSTKADSAMPGEASLSQTGSARASANVRICPKCGGPNELLASFCGSCGARLG